MATCNIYTDTLQTDYHHLFTYSLLLKSAISLQQYEPLTIHT